MLVWAVYAVGLAVWFVLPLQRGAGTAGGWVVELGVDLTRIAVTVGFLTAWGLWRPSGFATAPTWRRWVPALPLLVLAMLPALFGPGLVDRPAWRTAVLVLGLATVAFGEEGVFRGVVLRVLLARGVRAAVLGSAALFGVMHVVNLLLGSDPITVGGQVLMAAGLGIAFGAVVLATGTIWPVMVIHLVIDLVNGVQAAVPIVATEAGPAATVDLLVNAGINVALGGVAAAYGLWLLHRRVGLLRELDAGPGGRLPD
ncbi:CPBP family intramembrane metalloprotease [Actinotalea sp. M2MS4P-6]|nr:CPBP family intramembrane metalloprotease [Actinotalea sp. M2MS4P-6]